MADQSSSLKNPICWPPSRNDEHAEMGLMNSFGTKCGDKHDPFLHTFTITLHTLLDPPGSQIFLQNLVRKRVLDDSAASDLSELMDIDFLRLDALVRQRSCGGMYPEGEECIAEALAGVIGYNLLLELCIGSLWLYIPLTL